MSETVRITDADVIEISPLFLYRWEEPQQSYMLLYPEGVVKLNESAAAILGLCDGERSVKQIIDKLAEQYSGVDIANGVHKFLEVSHAKSWIRIKS
ncbi:MAG: pyrroloquinoline quinone biosynthesis peptide chaperone PqqD [Gammaproteobacteria bacterium]|nr:pyrroloquinoline quinone biosynthesis peptide chaperone PqqD [Gammaproteobacteria bacterium]